MDSNVLVALITASSSGLVAITALVLNYRGFTSIDGRFSSLDNRFAAIDHRFDSIDNRFNSIEHRLDAMQEDMKSLNKAMTALEIDVALVKDKIGL